MIILPKDYFHHNGARIDDIYNPDGVIDTIKVDGIIRYMKRPPFEIHIYSGANEKPSWAVHGSSAPLTYTWDATNSYWSITSYAKIDYLHPNAGAARQNTIKKVVAINLQGINSLKEMCMNFKEMVTFEVSSNAITSHITSFESLFNNCFKLENVDFMDMSNSTSIFRMYNDCLKIKYIPILNTTKGGNMTQGIMNCTELICVGGIDCRRATNTQYLFDGCDKLQEPTIPTISTIRQGNIWKNTYPCPNTNFSFMMEVRSVAEPMINNNGGTLIVKEIAKGVWSANSIVGPMHVSFQNHENNHSVSEVSITKASTLTFLGASFRWCRNVKRVIFADSNSTRNVTSIGDAFRECKFLTDIVNLNVTSCTEAQQAFYKCESLTTAGIVGSSGKIQNAENMFNGCKKIVAATLNIASVTNAKSMYSYSGVKTMSTSMPKIVNADKMFFNCLDLINVPAINMPEVTNTSGMFQACYNLESVSNMLIPKANTIDHMFEGCKKLRTVQDISLPEALNVSSMLSGCVSLESSYVTGLGKATNFSAMYNGCESLTTIGDIDYSSALSVSDMFRDCKSMATYGNINTAVCTQFLNLFFNNFSLTCIGKINTSATTSAGTGAMFGNTINLSAPNASDRALIVAGDNWISPGSCPAPTNVHIIVKATAKPRFSIKDSTKTVEVVDVGGGFWSIGSDDDSGVAINSSDSNMLLEVHILSLKVLSARDLFKNCINLTAVTMDNVDDLSLCTDFGFMFYRCDDIISVPAFNTSSGTNFENMYNGCSRITSIAKLDTSSGKVFTNMYRECVKLRCIGGVNTLLKTTTNGMFTRTPELARPTIREIVAIGLGDNWTNTTACP